jgi:ABC-type uncharacterized transport system YnjBCD permease subunit
VFIGVKNLSNPISPSLASDGFIQNETIMNIIKNSVVLITNNNIGVHFVIKLFVSFILYQSIHTRKYETYIVIIPMMIPYIQLVFTISSIKPTTIKTSE